MDEQLGETLLNELDELKGMAMKVGQILSYMDVGLPEEVTVRLSQLQRGVTPLPAEVVIRASSETSAGRCRSCSHALTSRRSQPLASGRCTAPGACRESRWR